MPAFDIEGGLGLALVRGLWVAALASVFGALVFWTLVVPPALARAPAEAGPLVHRSLRRLTWMSLAVALIMLAVWTLLESAQIAGVSGLAEAFVAAGEVVPGTTFGHVVLLQGIGLVAVATALGLARRWLAAGFAAAAMALQAGHGHALAMADGPSLLLLAGVLHVLAAGAWLGGLIPLLLVVRAAPFRTGAAACRWFSPLGKWCIALLVGSAAIQFGQLIGGLPGLVGTAYGWLASAKLVLLVALLGFAVVNRYGFAPRLLGPTPVAARSTLVRTIAVQTAVGVLVMLAAATLGSLPPAIHEQPIWPFALRPSLVALSGPELRDEVEHAAAGVLVGLALLSVAAALHRRRVLALVGLVFGLVLVAAAGSHMDLLFVEAYPTSYFQSPSGFAATDIVQGAALYPRYCAACHGVDGRGDGSAAKDIADPSADLAAGHLWAHDDGELFWWLTHGIDAPEGGLAMPGFADRLSVDDRWALIDYIRANNAGVGFRNRARWPVPIQAPGFALSCPGGRSVTTADLAGSVLHIVATAHADDAVPPAPEGAAVPVVTVLMTQGAEPPPRDSCVTADPVVWQAYATILGVPATDLAGAQILVDQNGWLRAAQRPGEVAMRWADPALLLADVQAICSHPIAAASVGHIHR